jgi:HSP20 family protein
MKASAKEIKFYYSQQTSEEPLIDLYESEDDLICEIDLPGIEPEDIMLKVVDDVLIIEGVKSDAEQKNKRLRYLCMERHTDSFRRVVKLPIRVNIHGAEASYSYGVVKIKFPKIKEKVVKIKIER